MGEDADLSRWMEAYLKAWHYMSALPEETALQGLLALAVRVGCDVEGDGAVWAEVSRSGRVWRYVGVGGRGRMRVIR